MTAEGNEAAGTGATPTGPAPWPPSGRPPQESQGPVPAPPWPTPTPVAPPGAYPAPWGGMGWWDGSQWSQLPPQPQYVEPYEPVVLLARATQALFGLLIALKVINLLLDLGRYHDAEHIVRARTFGEVLGGGTGAAIVVSLVTGLATIATIIVFLIWRYRVQKNLRGVMGVAATQFSPGWAVGWFFVPIANLWKPKQAMDEAWRASDPLLPAGTRGWSGRKVNPLLSWWWTIWILSFIVQIHFRIDNDPLVVTTGEFRANLVQEMLGLGVSALAAYLALQVVREITSRHRAKASLLGIPDT